MKLDTQDPRLMDYVLNELPADEAEEIRAALEEAENADAKAEVAALGALMGKVQSTLHSEEPFYVLYEDEREEILQSIQQPEKIMDIDAKHPTPNRFLIPVITVLSVAASLVLTFYLISSVDLEVKHIGTQLSLNSEQQAIQKETQYTNKTEVGVEESRESLVERGAKMLEKEADRKQEYERASTEKNYNDGLRNYRAGNYSEAINNFNRVIAFDPENVNAINYRKKSSEKIEKLNKDKILNSEPDMSMSPELMRQLAELGYDVGYPNNLGYEAEIGNTGNSNQPSGLSHLQKVRIDGQIRIRGNYYDGGEDLSSAEIANVEQRTGIGRTLETPDYLAQHTRLGVTADFTDEVSARIELDAYHVQSAKALSGQTHSSPGTESYADINDNPYTRVMDAPLSTFSIDVDTASYSNVRRFLNAGQAPPADAVRIEELINYFDYRYAPPRGEHPFAAHVELATCPWNAESYIARIGLKGYEMPASERPNGNYVFLVDVSGSMNQPNKLPLVKESLKTLLGQLGGRDRVGIVTYASGSAIHLPSTSCDDTKTINAAIDALRAGGSTHGSAGIQDAYAMARAHFIEGGVNRVILATDGDFNVGVTSHDALHSLIATEAKSNVFLTALGYGMGNYKDDRLELLADKGNGNYAYIDSYREVRRTLVEKLTSTIMTIAKDVKIQVEFNPAKVASYRLIGYENRMLAARDFNDDTKDAGEIGAGHTVTALYEIVPVGANPQPGVDPLRYQATPPQPEASADEASDEWFLLKLRYKQPEGDTSALMEIPVAQEPVSIESASVDTRFVAGVAAFGMVLRNSPHKGSATLDMAQQLVESSLNNDDLRQEFLDMIVAAKTLRR